MTTRPGYTWDDTNDEWVQIGPGVVESPVYYQATEPASAPTGSLWIDSDFDVPVSYANQYRWQYTATGGETSLSGGGLTYSPGYEQLFLNGILLVRGQDYVATTGTTITGLLALTAGDAIELLSIGTYPVTDTYTQAQVNALLALTTPVGTVNPYAGVTAPSNWLLCDGSAISRTTYSALFSVVSTTYGSGDGTTTFNLPDLRGRTVAGKDNMGGTTANRITSAAGGITATTLGAAGGDARLQAHTHSVPARYGANFWTSGFVQSTDGAGSSTPGVTGTAGDGSSGNVQPTLILNYIIKVA